MHPSIAILLLAPVCLAPTAPAQQGTFTPYGVGCPAPMGSIGAEFYEFFGATPDLANSSIELIPRGVGYTVQACAGNCWIAPTTGIVAMGDDVVVIRSIPFSFPHAGGSTNVVGFCSNGYVWLANNGNADYTPSVGEFLLESPRIAACWMDLNPSSGGITYFESSATRVVMTWSQVPEFGSTTNRNTFQVQLYPDGRIVLGYQVLASGQSVLVGYSRGGGVADPGPTDISAAMPFTTGSGIRPVDLARGTGTPNIGTTVNLLVSGQPSGTQAGLMLFGLYRLTHSLAVLGIPECNQYHTMEAWRFFTPSQPASTVPVPIPNNLNLVGVEVFVQAAVFAPGVNAYGVAVSNGGAITVGR